MPAILILTGAVAAGKNTIAHQYAMAHDKCADIDMDVVRWMLRQPHRAPWDADQVAAGFPQHKLAVKHSCLLAKSFIDEGYHVVITDVILPEVLSTYQQNLADYTYKIIKLMPTWDEVLRRLKARQPTISESEARWCYDKQLALSTVDLTIDNTTIASDDVVTQLLEFMN